MFFEAKEKMNIQSEFHHREDLRSHMAWIRSYHSLLVDNPHVDAAVLLGSFAKGHPDHLSDIDLIVFTEKSNLKAVPEELFRHRCYEVVHKWEAVFNEDHIFGKYIYQNFVSAEIHVLSHENGFKIRRPFISLKNSNDFIEPRVEEGEPPRHEDFSALPAGIDGLGWELFDMLKWWQRGKRDLVKKQLKKMSFIFRSSSGVAFRKIKCDRG